jgi:hypothetical protein
MVHARFLCILWIMNILLLPIIMYRIYMSGAQKRKNNKNDLLMTSDSESNKITGFFSLKSVKII